MIDQDRIARLRVMAHEVYAEYYRHQVAWAKFQESVCDLGAAVGIELSDLVGQSPKRVVPEIVRRFRASEDPGLHAAADLVEILGRALKFIRGPKDRSPNSSQPTGP